MTRSDDIETLAQDALRLLSTIQPVLQEHLRFEAMKAFVNGETPQPPEYAELWQDVMRRGAALFKEAGK